MLKNAWNISFLKLARLISTKFIWVFIASFIVVAYFSKNELFSMTQSLKISQEKINFWNYLYYVLNSRTYGIIHFSFFAIGILAIELKDINHYYYFIRSKKRTFWFLQKTIFIVLISIVYPFIHGVFAFLSTILFHGFPNGIKWYSENFSVFPPLKGLVLLYCSRVAVMLLLSAIFLLIYVYTKKITQPILVSLVYLSTCTFMIYVFSLWNVKQFTLGAAVSLLYFEKGALSENEFNVFVLGGITIVLLLILSYQKLQLIEWAKEENDLL